MQNRKCSYAITKQADSGTKLLHKADDFKKEVVHFVTATNNHDAKFILQ
jgi:hypothetical protein